MMENRYPGVKWQEVVFDLRHMRFPVQVPGYADVLRMGTIEAIPDPGQAILEALKSPINSPPLGEIVRRKLRSNPHARAVIVISDNTRPVPYSGRSGLLFPVIDEMMRAGLPARQIRLLVATGTHRAMDERELREMIDPRVLALDLAVTMHDARDANNMISVCRTDHGGEISVNKIYVQSDIKILTGLVESHFMAGASGGRKSICPGLISEESTHALHSGPILDSPFSRDLVLDGNPVHEEALKVAREAGCDMVVNVTLDANYEVTGIFAGSLEHAHRAAFNKLRTYAAIPFVKKYDIVITHTGFVGVNHYQAAKGALVCVPLVKKEGFCILGACHTDKDPVGGKNYKRMLELLGKVGAEQYIRLILDPKWIFVPEQWEAQMWTRLFEKIPPQNLLYCCLEIPDRDFSWIPGENARKIVQETESLEKMMNKTVTWALRREKERLGRYPDIAILPDGPYGIPLSASDP
jgi:nickel-dependent lactate racemase